MKSFFHAFSDSFKEFGHIRTIVVTGIFIAVSMLIESFTISTPFFKINFAFLAIAVIGMLFGPAVGFAAGAACDIVGVLVHPDGGFFPVYVLLGALQGFIYGVTLYRKMDSHSICVVNNRTQKSRDITLYLRASLARLLDVVVINIFLNTKANLHYGFITAESYSAAVMARVAKNVIELFADLPLLFVFLAAALAAYNRTFSRKAVTKA